MSITTLAHSNLPSDMSQVNQQFSDNQNYMQSEPRIKKSKKTTAPWRCGNSHHKTTRIQAVLDYESGKLDFMASCKKYDIWPCIMKNWIKKYGHNVRPPVTTVRTNQSRQEEWTEIMRKMSQLDSIINDISKALNRIS